MVAYKESKHGTLALSIFFVLIVAPSSVLGYVPVVNPRVPAFILQRIAQLPDTSSSSSYEPSSSALPPSDSNQPRQKVKYDLGIGKNLPVGVSKSAISNSAHKNQDDHASAARFWIVPEPVVKPRDCMSNAIGETDEMINKEPPTAPLAMKNFPGSIMNSEKEVVSESGKFLGRDYDLNTIWVQMLIADQKSQMVHA
eukprot:scaffold20828_cov56-Attheya_sp.AAC.2